MPSDSVVKQIFGEALDKRAVDRSMYLDAACAGDAGLRRLVETLLASAEKPDGFLSDATMDTVIRETKAIKAEGPGFRIGPYRLIEQIGEGGFGSVFMAEQERPVRRLVAFKIIKLGMDTKAVVGRFEQERQALAVMDHPHIAKVLDAGATETGRPYFVMELVKGDPITAYCDKNNLTIPERLTLFTQVCQAVQHAHTKGVIHRDIKPSNILVTTQDGIPNARVIDFGIAKATNHRLTEKTLFTEFRQLIGTPEYMSPEQAEGGLDIDTRTDVYSLGVLLYELLSGVTPFDAKTLRSAAFAELQRIIREVDPPKPSTRLLQSHDTLAGIAAKRRTEPRRLTSTIRGELDWIVMKALEKDRGRRYDSAGNLAADVSHYLDGRPVDAAPPKASYRFRKFARRHRVVMTAASLVAAALLAGLSAALWQASVAARQRDAANKAAGDAIAAKKEAEDRRKETEQISEFQASQLRGIDVEQMGERLRGDLLAGVKESGERTGLTAAQIQDQQAQLAALLGNASLTGIALKTLDQTIFTRAMDAAEVQFKDLPLVKANLLQTLAVTMRELGIYERADAAQSEALSIRRTLLGEENEATLDSLAESVDLLQAEGKLAEAEPVYRDLMVKQTRAFGPDDRRTITSKSNLALALLMQNRLEEGEPLLKEVFERTRQLFGPDDPDAITTEDNLGGLACEQGRLAESEILFRDVLDRQRRAKGEGSREVAHALNNVGTAIERQGRLMESEPYYREALELARRHFGENHPDTLLFLNNVGFVLYEEGKYAEAEPVTRASLEGHKRVLGDDNWETLQSLHNLGLLLQATDRAAEAEATLREAFDRRRRALGDDHPSTLQSMCSLGVLLREQGRLDEAEPLLRASFEGRKRFLREGHADILQSMHELGCLLTARGEPSPAEVLLRQALAGREKVFGPESGLSAMTRSALGEALAAQGHWPDAEQQLLAAETHLAATRDGPARRHTDCMRAIITFYQQWDKADAGKGHDAKANEWTGRLNDGT
jgi:serine/threonine protein kinase/tetratricopeptide (TPR) repeat protein